MNCNIKNYRLKCFSYMLFFASSFFLINCNKIQYISKNEVYSLVDWTKIAQLKAKLFPAATNLDSNQIIFVAWHEQSRNKIPVLLDLHFIKSPTESNVGIYRLSIRYTSMLVDFYNISESHKFVLNYEPYSIPIPFTDSYHNKHRQDDFGTIINCYAIGVFRIVADSLYLEQSLPLHYKDSICNHIPDLDKCICNPKKYRKKVPNDEIFFTPPPSYIEWEHNYLNVPFGLEIEADTFLIKSATRYNTESYNTIQKRRNSTVETISQPIIALKSCSKQLKINKWASIEEISRYYSNQIEKNKFVYSSKIPQNLSLDNARMLLEKDIKKPKNYRLYEDLSGMSSLNFSDCSTASQIDTIYKILLDYTYRSK